MLRSLPGRRDAARRGSRLRCLVTGIAALCLLAPALAHAAPAAPTNLAATSADQAIDLKWSPVAGADGYNVYRSRTTPVAEDAAHRVNSTPVPPPSTRNVKYTDSGLQNGVAYYYAVSALASGSESGLSTQIQAIPLGHPYVNATSPTFGAINQSLQPTISANLTLVNNGAAVDPATLVQAGQAQPATVTIKPTLPTGNTNYLPTAKPGTDGAGALITLTPSVCLQPATKYTVTIQRVKDLLGATFTKKTWSFTTGTSSSGGCSASTAQRFARQTVASAATYTSLTIGPVTGPTTSTATEMLYAAALDGNVYRYPINADGTLDMAHAPAPLNVPNAEIVGLAFEPGPAVRLWVTANAPVSFDPNNPTPDWSGTLQEFSGPNLGTRTVMAIHLPRSAKDHETNSIAFSLDGNWMYFTQGSNAAMGAPDQAWGMRSEHLLTAALLRVDYKRLDSLIGTSSLPLDLQTEPANGDAGSYDPYDPGAPVTLLADGLRNAFDIVVQRSTGNLYLPTNGSAGGGNVPGIPPTTDPSFPTARCDARGYNGPTGLFWPGGITNLSDQRDFLFRVDPSASPTGTDPWRPYGYYGHPDPARCEWIQGSGNPGSTNRFKAAKVKEYPLGTQADANYRGYVFDFGYHASPDGAIEYRSHVFAGTSAGDLSGTLLVTRYSIPDDVLALTLNASGDVTGAPRTLALTTPLSSDYPNFDNPIDIVEDPANSYANGRLYVSELDPQGGRTIIELLTPQTS